MAMDYCDFVGFSFTTNSTITCDFSIPVRTSLTDKLGTSDSKYHYCITTVKFVF